MTIESKTADTILERKKEIVINGKTYQVAPPSTATLIEVSELLSQMPQVDLNPKNIVSESLMIARKCRVLGDVVALLILGEGTKTKGIEVVKKRFFGLRTERHILEVDLKAELAQEALSMGPKLLEETTGKLLAGMEIGSFFALTTFLIEVNLTRPTREVETIQSGH